MKYAVFAFEMLIFLLGMYYLAIAFFSLAADRRERPRGGKMNTFAIVVAAHNEEKVIGGLLESVNALTYPKELFDVFVVADNCTDGTGAIASEYGAVVYERTDEVKKGKGFALEYAFDRIFNSGKKYDYIVVFDADNIVKNDFLLCMNREVNSGYRAVQGYLDSKNPYSSWLAFSYSLWYWLNNRLSQRSRGVLELGCRLGGTGFAVASDLIREIGWGATCLAEDTEFTLKLALIDEKVGWAHDAVVYDEKPDNMSTSVKQRTRWMQGLSDVAKRFIIPLFKKSFKEGKIAPVHMAMNFWGDMLYPTCLIVLGIIDVLTIASTIIPHCYLTLCAVWYNPFNLIMLNAYLMSNLIIAIASLYKDKKLNLSVLKHIFGFMLYILSWIPVFFLGLFKKDGGEWFHTPHTVGKNYTDKR